jgi:hypothetical protein
MRRAIDPACWLASGALLSWLAWACLTLPPMTRFQ